VTLSSPSADHLLVRIAGDVRLADGLPEIPGLPEALAPGSEVRRVSFDATDLGEWDSALITLLLRVLSLSAACGAEADRSGLPEGVRRLLALATAVAERQGARRSAKRTPFFVRVGEGTIRAGRSLMEGLAFIGEVGAGFGRLLRGKAKMRRADFVQTLRESGFDALPIVSLICCLVGLILAFIGAVQLMMFGAQIYVASLVGIAMVRVMGAVMAGIIMAGRTATSFAAQLGTMQINEEIDALKTLGISPMEYLVLPRMLALFIMMPLLCLYADLMGILGGFIVGVGMLGLGPLEYFHQTKDSVGLASLWIGLFHGAVFGVLIALAGCMRGMQCKRSASAVGDATRGAAVTAIVSIIVATAIITILCSVVGI
jgi:phospholipid/cholesterol/gamma-HCH transport system permease protein